MLVLSFKNGDNDPARALFNKYYMLLVETEYFNALIDNKTFFGLNLKNKQEEYEELVEMLINSDYTTANLLDY